MRRMFVLLTALVLVAAGCGSDEPTASEAAQDAPETAASDAGQDAPEEAAATVEVAESDLGEVLVDAEGNTLYMFDPDEEENGKPTCYDECAQAWPAFEATDEQSAGSGVDEAMLGTVERTDGTEQVTYNDLPLYYFSGDEAAGDTNGQGVNEVWWVMSPSGEPIRDGKTTKDEPY